MLRNVMRWSLCAVRACDRDADVPTVFARRKQALRVRGQNALEVDRIQSPCFGIALGIDRGQGRESLRGYHLDELARRGLRAGRCHSCGRWLWLLALTV